MANFAVGPSHFMAPKEGEMEQSPLGRTLVIANPAASSGKGAQAAEFVGRFLDAYPAATRAHKLIYTQGPLDAVRLAREARGVDTVVALGGDGVIHEVVNGLMERPRADRPNLAIIPMGSGNDYARTLGMEMNNPSASLSQLVSGRIEQVEVGRVNQSYFMQTLSFGLDAAVALDTVDRRQAKTSQEGEELFITSCLKIFSRSSKGWRCNASFDGGKIEQLRSIIFAMQVGPTYGGGFKICPDASPTDGLLDTCYNVKNPPAAWTLALVGSARFGLHTHSSCVKMRRFSHADLTFESEPPCQMDGERLVAKRFVVDVVPKALSVVMPRA
jgi:YegS/Rv2252/BmrU family lipid kinase